MADRWFCICRVSPARAAVSFLGHASCHIGLMTACMAVSPGTSDFTSDSFRAWACVGVARHSAIALMARAVPRRFIVSILRDGRVYEWSKQGAGSRREGRPDAEMVTRGLGGGGDWGAR